ncbi:NicO-domain-containing protein [Aspergillus saccharolyticus JOP 1030-1]|uniref:NicO-domain-containing protein n=1 Tax=Aspergillus saccharolyticus JOP 1030-1 TaxID=1450539 RepID=A0A318ZSR3_9EURO|nr:NicO-domain-containing protein [Aspergillus saccharolyticus JOP 1030-1]PYH43108.1 NicO-domain-containing protein [Aspergillus saccharolyticus JOP 1030-1]
MRDSSSPSPGETSSVHDTLDRKWTPKFLVQQAEKSHRRLPGIRKIPLSAIGIILFIAFLNVVVWIAAAIVLRYHPSLVSNAVLSYTLGMRHAFDADHISAIDLMTRRLLATGQKPVTVGTFFSLGHSTIVIITSIVVAATAAAISSRFDSFSTIGGIIGTSVSAAFLILLGVMNAYILYKLYRQMQKVLDLPEGQEDEMWKIEGGGVLFKVLKRMFKLIDRPWKMYPLGILFGLGFDTSSEIALLGISSVEAAKGTNFWVILIFPALFTAGMCLLDTTDGALMLSLYVQPSANFLPPKSDPDPASDENESSHEGDGEVTAAKNHRDPIAFLYYSIVLTSLTVIVAIVIGIIQVLTLVLNVAHPTGKFWDGVQVAGDYYDAIGGGISSTSTEGDDPDPSRLDRLDFSACPPIYVLQTHLSIEALHEIEEELVHRNARLTYDIDEARLILGKISQPKRAALDLRTLGLWTEAIPERPEGPPVKRRRGNGPGAEVIDLSTETEDEADGMSVHASARHVAQPQTTNETDSDSDGASTNIRVIKLDWLHQCIRTNTLLPPGAYTIYHARRIARPSATQTPLPKPQPNTTILQRAKADASMQPPRASYQPQHRQHPRTHAAASQTTIIPTLHRTTTSEAEETASLPPPPDWVTSPTHKGHTYACLRSTPLHPPNEPFIAELLQIRHIRELTLDEIGVRAYSTAIAAIAAYPEPLHRPAEVLRLPGCDAKIANLFYEFQLAEARASEGEDSPRPSQAQPDPAESSSSTTPPPPKKGILTATHPLTTDPTLRTLDTFYNIWGVGAKTAQDFYYRRGWRSLDDVVEYGWHSLTRVQQIGVKYYEEFQERILRAEVEAIAGVVLRHANRVVVAAAAAAAAATAVPQQAQQGQAAQQGEGEGGGSSVGAESATDDDDDATGPDSPSTHQAVAGGVECIITGSHRRGKASSGDVDLILTHRDESATKNLITEVLRSLETEGWITHTLVLHAGHSARDQQTAPYKADAGESAVQRKMFDSLDKGLVVWQDPPPPPSRASPAGETRNTNPHRRVDIIISPWRTVGCAVLGWSGDKTFERDLRRFAKKERGWKFDSSGVRERTSGGHVVDLEAAGETWQDRERLVMEGLGIGWRPPEERCTR